MRNCTMQKVCRYLNALVNVEKNTISNLEFLHESFPKVNLFWDIQLLNHVIILRRKLMTFDNSHVDFQVLTIYEDENTKTCNAILSNPEEIIVENIKNTSVEIMKDVYCKKIDYTGLRFKHEILS